MEHYLISTPKPTALTCGSRVRCQNVCAQVSDSAGLLCVHTCTPRATTTHNSTSHFAVERFLGLYHDAPGGVRFLLLYEVKPFWLRSLSGLQIKSNVHMSCFVYNKMI